MARQTLFDTDTADFFEVIGNGRRYAVPSYQRDYSWGESQWEDLWNDIRAIHESRSSHHYMGALVVEAQADRQFLVIDGQQRLATLSIIAIVIIDALNALADRGIEPENNRQRAELLRNDFVGETNRTSLVRSSKLTLNNTDNGFYQDTIVQSRDARGAVRLPHSNKALNGARSYFKLRLKESLPEDDGAALASLLSETIARGLFFILITVEDDANAYTIFETLNARGLELTTTDLLKNYLFSQMTSGTDLAHVQRRWNALIAQTTQERFPDFLRYHMLVQERQVRKEQLFKKVRDRVRGAPGALNLLDEIEPRADVFNALSDPSHSLWEESPVSRRAVQELKLFGSRQMTPLVFAASERLDPAALGAVLRMLSVISFRYSVVGALNTNELEPTYHEAAAAVIKGQASTPKAIFDSLQKIYVTDEAFQADFEAWEIGSSRHRLARYVLIRLEADASGRALDPITDPATIEHILPENPDSTWENAIPVSAWDRAAYRLGNLALLSASANRRIGNAAYDEKREAYTDSLYVTTKRIPEDAPEEWTLDHISKRQRQLAKRAVHLWRVNL